MRNQHDLIVCHVCLKLRLKEPEFGAQNEDSSGRGHSAVATSGSRSSLRAVSAFGETCIATKSTSAPPINAAPAVFSFNMSGVVRARNSRLY